MKLSAYHKKLGDTVELKVDYENLKNYDLVYISKVFTDTNVPLEILELSNVKCGGTGFFYDNAEPLPYEVEHHMPDYHLYDEWVETQLSQGKKRRELEYYLDYSIGFTTRGCFRKCGFCVNKESDRVLLHSSIDEFLNNSRKYICLLDDNVLGCGDFKNIINKLKGTKKSFQFKQGLDIRLVTNDIAKLLNTCKYKGDFIFAFDNINDKKIVEKKLQIWRLHCRKSTKLYVLCAFDRDEKYNEDFWMRDVLDAFERIEILIKHQCLPYIMRYEKYQESPYRGIYITLARWCNQPNFVKKMSFKEFCVANGVKSSAYRYMSEFEKLHPDIAKQYFDMKWEDVNQII